LVVAPRLIVRADGEEASVSSTVVDEEGGGFLVGVYAVHDLYPDVYHLDGLFLGPELADVLVEGDFVVLGLW
jgi:hypothetical protein